MSALIASAQPVSPPDILANSYYIKVNINLGWSAKVMDNVGDLAGMRQS
jgi:hypothetical protein